MGQGDILTMSRRRSYLAGLIILVLCLPAALLQARVFRSGGWSSGGSPFAVEEFGRRLYKTVMRINGGQADVSVASCREGMESVRQRVLAGQGVTSRFAGGETLGLGEIIGLGRVVRLVALVPGGDPAAGVVVAVERAQQEDRASRSALALKHELREMPVIPGSQVTGYMKNEDTRVAWETLLVPASVASAVAYHETTLKQAGWAPVMPLIPSDEGGMLLFTKGPDICCVRVKRSDLDGETRVALLHKQGALK